MTPNELINLLAVSLGDNPKFRETLIDAVVSIAENTTRPVDGKSAKTNYIALLDMIKTGFLPARGPGGDNIREALKNLCETIRKDLFLSAENLHQSLRAGASFFPEKDIKKTGIAPIHLPFDFPPKTDLLRTAKECLEAVSDRRFLKTRFKDDLSRLSRQIEERIQALENELTGVAWQALMEVIDAPNDRPAKESIRNNVIAFENERIQDATAGLADIVRMIEDQSVQTADITRAKELIHDFQKLQETIGAPLYEAINAFPNHGRTLLTLLIHSKTFVGLDDLSNIRTHESDEDFFNTLMILRFGDKGFCASEEWKNWIHQQVDQFTGNSDAVLFIKRNPSLILELFSDLDFPDQIRSDWQKRRKETTREHFFNRCRSMMTEAEIAFFERLDDEKADQMEKPGADSSVINELGEAAVDVTMGDSLSEAAFGSGVEIGLTAISEKMTVSIDETDEAEPPLPPSQETPLETIWTNVIAPFITRNLVFVLAPSFIFIGLLMLVFTLWDKEAWIRYALTPFMIGCVSFALSRIGGWLKSQHIQTLIPLAILQGVSIFLAPMGFIFVALLAADVSISFWTKVVWCILLSGILIIAWRYIFMHAISTISSKYTTIHSYSLLLINALLLLLPLSQSDAGIGAITAREYSPGLLVAGFYSGFAILVYGARKVMSKLDSNEFEANRIPLIFYYTTCLGTFFLAWALTHARIAVWPKPYTYAPLLIILSYVFSLFDFKRMRILENDRKISILGYLSYGLITLGVLLSIGHDVVRVVSVIMAGAVWLYHAETLKAKRHFEIALILFVTGLSGVCLMQHFPAPFFPYLALVYSVCLYTVHKRLPHKLIAESAGRIGPVYLSLAFMTSILWQWTGGYPPFYFGPAFVLYGLFTLHVGEKSDKLTLVHAGAGYLAASLLFLGFSGTAPHTLSGNTLVFGLSLLGGAWILICRINGLTAIRDSRSTVLWNIGLLAFAVMMLRLWLNDEIDPHASFLLQIQMLSGPILMSVLMILTGFFTRSYIPVYLALLLPVILLPEVKTRFGIVMYSGLGTTLSAIGLLVLAVLIKRAGVNEKADKTDLIWRKRVFPFQAKGHALFTRPLIFASLFLLFKVILWNYLYKFNLGLIPLTFKTPAAVLLAGVAFLFFSIWFKKKIFSYIGFAAVACGILHGFDLASGVHIGRHFLPVFILSVLVCVDLARMFIKKVCVPENGMFVIRQTPDRPVTNRINA
ncbi:hypothetical protein ACFLZM_06395, partial [Thermodesulfobacteriota bacterium]